MATIISGDRTIEAHALALEVGRAAASLQASGIGAGSAVALLLRNDIPFFSVSLAARMLGAYVMPVNWHATPAEIAFVLEDSRARLLIGHADLLAQLAPVPSPIRLVSVPTPVEIADAYRLAPELLEAAGALSWVDWLADDSLPVPATPPPAPSAMIYTSGTTGRPKGVRRQPLDAAQTAAQQRTASLCFGLRPDEPAVVLMTGPMYHTAPNAYGMMAATLGADIVLQPRFDALELLALVERHRVTHMHMVPVMFVRLLALDPAVRERFDLTSLRFVIHGAAPCPIAIKRQMIDWWGPVIHEYYGSTETGITCCHDSAEALKKPGTVGRPLPGAVVRILDDSGISLPPGVAGDVFMWSEAMSDFTYHGRNQEREAIGRDGLVTVGDVGWCDDEGYLFLCDRRRDMIISGGVNIYPAEIEAELLLVAGVRDCAVFGVPDPEYGEAVCAVIEPAPGADLSRDGIRAALGGRLARFKLPKIVEFRASLPREDSGKIFKRVLREPYWAQEGRAI